MFGRDEHAFPEGSSVRRLRIAVVLFSIIVSSTAFPQTHSHPATAKSSFQRALHSAVAGTSAAALVLDVASGNLLASDSPENADQFQFAPGSILKPFFLAGALESRVVQSQTIVVCHRSLRVLGHNLSCSHPQTDVAFNAEEALAYSCNTYFADLAGRMPTEQLLKILRDYGFGKTANSASQTSPVLHKRKTREDKQLFVLGLAGISVSPAEVAFAYRRLALKFSDPNFSPMLAPVEQGMLDSVRFGAAHNAEVPGLNIAGKTGTASDPRQTWTHGWFAGMADIGLSRIVIVVYLPHGNGADAATIAHRFFLSVKAGQAQ